MGQINHDFKMVTGKVKAVRFKKKAKPDNFDNIYTAMIFIEGVNKPDGDGEICFLGNTKKEKLVGKKDGDYIDVLPGHEVKFGFKENNGFYNYKGGVEVTGGEGRSQGSGAQNQTGTFENRYDPNKPNPAEVGQCINLAVELKLAKKYEDLLNPEVIDLAIRSYKEVKKTFTDNWNEKPVQNTPEPLPVEEYDIPF